MQLILVLLTFVFLTQSFSLIIQSKFLSNIFACSVVLRHSFNDRYNTTEELELEADSILEEGFEEFDSEDELLE